MEPGFTQRAVVRRTLCAGLGNNEPARSDGPAHACGLPCRHRRTYNSAMPNITTADLSIYYEEQGSGAPLLCIAGLGASLDSWTPVRERLADQFRVITFDNRGMGRTRGPDRPFHMEDMVADTVALLDALNIRAAHVAGHSLGGAIAQCLALRQPARVRSMTLCNSFARIRPAAVMAFRANADLLRAGVPLHLVFQVILPWLFSDAFFQSETQMRALVEQVRASPPQQSLADFERQLAVAANFDSENVLNRLLVPTLVIAGEHDIMIPVTSARRLAGQIPHARFETVSAGHLGLVEAAAEYARLIAGFIRTQ